MLTHQELERLGREAERLRPLIRFLREQGYHLSGIARLLSFSEPVESLLTRSALHSLVYSDELSAQRSVLGTMVQLFLFASRVDLRAYELLPAAVRELCERYRLVALEGQQARGEVCICELDSRYYLSDRLFENRGNLDLVMCDPEGLVMPVHESSLRLLRFLERPHGGSFLDIGTGCGVLALATRAGCTRSKAIDLLPRAALLARINSVLNELEVECEQGDCFTFSDGTRYDQIAFNAPWVLDYKASAPLAQTSPLANVLRFLDERLERLLAPGGVCQLWSVFPVQSGDEGPEQVFERRLPRSERFRISVQPVREGGFHIAPAAIASRKLPRGSYLLQNSSDAPELLAFIERNGIKEVLPVLIRVQLSGEQRHLG